MTPKDNEPIDMEKAKRERTRWLIMTALNSARPIGTAEGIILSAVEGAAPGITQLEIRRELEYLEDRGLLDIEGKGRQPEWHVKLTHHGVDVVEYTVDCHPGIGRPQKWW